MKLKTRIQLVLMPRSSWWVVLGLILPVDKNPKMQGQTLIMAVMDIRIKNQNYINQNVLKAHTNTMICSIMVNHVSLQNTIQAREGKLWVCSMPFWARTGLQLIQLRS